MPLPCGLSGMAILPLIAHHVRFSDELSDEAHFPTYVVPLNLKYGMHILSWSVSEKTNKESYHCCLHLKDMREKY